MKACPFQSNRRRTNRTAAAAVAVLGTTLTIPACSLVVDTTPDGLKAAQGGQPYFGSAGVSASSGVGNGFGSAGSSSSSTPMTAAGRSNSGGQTSGTPATGGAVTGGQPDRLASAGSGGDTTPSTTSAAIAGSPAGGFTSGTAGLAGAAGISGTVGTGGTLGCPSVPLGPAMVKMPGDYCIDATEVTRVQYAAWLRTLSPDSINTQNASCRENLAFEPNPTCMATGNVCALACDNHPQVCVDWCDAYAYCKAVGKRLCGRIGGGPNAFGDYGDATKSQWYNACSVGGTQIYPYGDTYQSSYCNGAEYGTGTTVSVGFLVKCRSPVPYAGVSDMSGNVSEWEDSCEGESCRLRGGGFYATVGTVLNEVVACASSHSAPPRTWLGSASGFRCCFP